jgi:hypothetical protein
MRKSSHGEEKKRKMPRAEVGELKLKLFYLLAERAKEEFYIHTSTRCMHSFFLYLMPRCAPGIIKNTIHKWRRADEKRFAVLENVFNFFL